MNLGWGGDTIQPTTNGNIVIKVLSKVLKRYSAGKILLTASTDKFLMVSNRSASEPILTASRTGETLNKERSANLYPQILRYCSFLALLEAEGWTT